MTKKDNVILIKVIQNKLYFLNDAKKEIEIYSAKTMVLD